jgi:hypothetical protein
VVLCVFSVGYFVGLTVAQTTTTITIEPNSFQTEASYVIFKDGTTIKARNGTTGAIDYSGTEAVTVMQLAYNALTSGGIIFIKKGYYDVSSNSFKLRNDLPIYIKGEGMGATILDAGSAAGATVFEVVDSGNAPYWNKFIAIEDLTVNALNGYGLRSDVAWTSTDAPPYFMLRNINFGQHWNKGCKYAIKINGPYYSYFENIKVFNNAGVSGSIGLWLTNTVAGWHCGNSVINDFYYQSDNNNATGILIDATLAQNANINMIDFYHTEIHGGTYGIDINATDSTKSSVHSIGFYGVNVEGTTNPIRLRGRTDLTGGWGEIMGITFSDLFVDGTILLSGNYGVEGISFTGGFIWNLDGTGANAGSVVLETLRVQGTITKGGLSIKAIYVTTYRTENSGTATFSGNGSQTQFTIAHGLAGTPTTAVVTAGSNDAKGDFYVTYDATNIYVTYATAPPSGTNNVVLRWYAKCG